MKSFVAYLSDRYEIVFSIRIGHRAIPIAVGDFFVLPNTFPNLPIRQFHLPPPDVHAE